MKDSKFYGTTRNDNRWIVNVLLDGSDTPPEIHVTDIWGITKVKMYFDSAPIITCTLCGGIMGIRILRDDRSERRCPHCGEILDLGVIISKFLDEPLTSHIFPTHAVADPLFLDLNEMR